jgi:prepilin-type N-terminal cleavage/methylation domain-containing protein
MGWKKMKNNQGFSLLEVLIALTLFGVFATVYLSSQGYLIGDSTVMRNENILRTLAEYKMNQVILDPPEFIDSLENRKDKKVFDEDIYKNFEYTVEYKKLNFPDLSTMTSSGQDEKQPDPNESVKKVVFEKIKKNLDTMVWQIKVTIKDKTTDHTFSLSTWYHNTKAQVELDIGF